MPKTPEERAAYKRDWYMRNRERMLEQRRAYYRAHRDEQLARQRERVAQPEVRAARLEYGRRYYIANADTIRARASAWHANATPEQRAKKRQQSADARRGSPVRAEQARAEQRAVRAEVIEGYGGSCTCCGNAYLPHLTLDHVNGNGNEHRRTENSRVLYRRLRRMLREGAPNDPMFQVLCWNCNLAKHHYGFCGCQH